MPTALAEFNAARDRSIQLVHERGDSLYAIGAKHPHFGNVNGVELLQMIDGHTRRHADQIRELRQATPPTAWQTMNVRVKPVKAKKPVTFKRDAPDLPPEFASAAPPDALLDTGKFVNLKEQHLQDLDRTNLKIDTFQLDGCLLNRVQLSDGQFGSAVWKDVRFIGCDLANIRVHRLALVRVEFVDCRLTGFHATAIDWQDVLIQNGEARYSQWQGGKFRTCEFAGCDFQDADFQEADLSGSRLRSCNLARADLRKTKLRNTDFRRSEVDTMLVEMNDLQGAIVDPAQAMIFARIMGLQIA